MVSYILDKKPPPEMAERNEPILQQPVVDNNVLKQIISRSTEHQFNDYKNCSIFGTITLLPSLYVLPSKEQFKKTFDKTYLLLKKQYNCFLLVAELTKDGNIHYHYMSESNDPEIDSFVMVDKIKTYNYKHKNNPIFGFSKIEQIKDATNTYIYITKDCKKTCRVIMGVPWSDHKQTNVISNNTTFNKIVKRINIITQKLEPTVKHKTVIKAKCIFERIDDGIPNNFIMDFDIL